MSEKNCELPAKLKLTLRYASLMRKISKQFAPLRRTEFTFIVLNKYKNLTVGTYLFSIINKPLEKARDGLLYNTRGIISTLEVLIKIHLFLSSYYS